MMYGGTTIWNARTTRFVRNMPQHMEMTRTDGFRLDSFSGCLDCDVDGHHGLIDVDDDGSHRCMCCRARVTVS